ncbi:hypothetical protein MMC07_008305 [Pseudocyphellaria aurata]|nr:hypothetical protein [Pseudocyphellaria aurata]
MAKYHLKDMRDLTLSHTKERLKLVEQKIRDKTTQNGETANKAGGEGEVLQVVDVGRRKGIYKKSSPRL